MTPGLWFITTILPITVTSFGVAVYLWHTAWLKRELANDRAAAAQQRS